MVIRFDSPLFNHLIIWRSIIWSSIGLLVLSSGPQVMNGPSIGDNEQEDESVQDAFFAKRLVSPDVV